SFYDPAHLTKPAAMRRTPLGDSWCDAEPGQQPTRVIAVIATIGIDHVRQFGRTPWLATNNRIIQHKRHDLSVVTGTRPGGANRQGNAVAIDHDGVFGA